MAELVDATDLKSVEVHPRAGSIPASGTSLIQILINLTQNPIYLANIYCFKDAYTRICFLFYKSKIYSNYIGFYISKLLLLKSIYLFYNSILE